MNQYVTYALKGIFFGLLVATTTLLTIVVVDQDDAVPPEIVVVPPEVVVVPPTVTEELQEEVSPEDMVLRHEWCDEIAGENPRWVDRVADNIWICTVTSEEDPVIQVVIPQPDGE